MERTIGDVGQGIRQPSNPFSNLCKLALRTSQINELKTICPELDREPQHPKSARNLRNGYIVLGPRSRYLSKLDLGAAWDLIHVEFPLMKETNRPPRCRKPTPSTYPANALKAHAKARSRRELSMARDLLHAFHS